jgi:3D (Asp-Asp-Asp) domain-containing protein
VRVAFGSPVVIFVVVDLTGDAASQTPHQFQVTHATEAGSMVEDRGHDLLLALEFAPNVASSICWASAPGVDGDLYEPDDTCIKASALTIGGTAQRHTFHQRADNDWAWFNVVSGTTYIIQTSNTQANADTTLELRSSCAQPPLRFDDNAFGRDARITWQATFSGTVYVKVSNHNPLKYGPDTGYDLSVRPFIQPPVVVIVGGHDDGYSLQANIDHAADMAYRTFVNSGVPKAHVRYFGPNPHRDVDGNGLLNDIYATVTITGVRSAVQEWSREQGVQLGVPFYVYLVDHGHYDQFLAAGTGGKITASDLDLWLTNLEAMSGADNVNVIVEACHGGSFIDVTTLGPAEVSGRNRVVIASTSSALNAYASAEGAYFSDAFWTALGQNQDLKTAFERAAQAVGTTGLSQQPWLDDNGDAAADGRDGALARSRGLGGAFAGSPPAIDWVRVGVMSDGQAAVQAQVRDDYGVSGVWAVVYPPGFVEPEPTQDGTTPVLNVPTATLTLAGVDLYGTVYQGFTQTGQYRLVMYAQDGDGNQALPQGVQICVGCVYLPLVVRNR